MGGFEIVINSIFFWFSLGWRGRRGGKRVKDESLLFWFFPAAFARYLRFSRFTMYPTDDFLFASLDGLFGRFPYTASLLRCDFHGSELLM